MQPLIALCSYVYAYFDGHMNMFMIMCKCISTVWSIIGQLYFFLTSIISLLTIFAIYIYYRLYHQFIKDQWWPLKTLGFLEWQESWDTWHSHVAWSNLAHQQTHRDLEPGKPWLLVANYWLVLNGYQTYGSFLGLRTALVHVQIPWFIPGIRVLQTPRDTVMESCGDQLDRKSVV